MSGKGTRPESPLRRSARLDRLNKTNKTEAKPSQQPLLAPGSNGKGVKPTPPSPTHRSPSKPLKRKREADQHLKESLLKRPRTSPTPALEALEDADPVAYWTQTCHWPGRYFRECIEMNHLLARKKSTASLRRKRSDSALSAPPNSVTPSDQKDREEKSAPYKDARYETLLATKGSFLCESDLGVNVRSMTVVHGLLEKAQPVPKDSLFRDDLLKSTLQKIQNRNETRVVRDISQLIVPSAEVLATYGATALDCLIESTNEGWNNSIPLTNTRPQPDYSVGFRREAFSESQLQKLQPFVGDLTDTSFFMGTFYMYFPFFSAEVKCGAAALDVADRQNAHSMTLAVRGVVELFRLVKREKELHREILAFSISHDHRMVRIYGHYPVIDDKKTAFYRRAIHAFDFTVLDGREKWTAYKFARSVYDSWMPAHFKRLCSAINAIPADIHFEVSEESDLQFPSSSGLSQGLESHRLSVSAVDLEGPELTPDTSTAQTPEGNVFQMPKKPKNK